MNPEDDMPAHGGRLAEIGRRWPDAPRPLIDLSTGISPYPYPISADLAGACVRLPEPEAEDALRSAACGAYGVASPDLVAASPGSQALISILPHLLAQTRVAILSPTYGGHAQAWNAASKTVREVATFAEPAAGEAWVVCRPNNPDGVRLPRAAVSEMAAACARVGSWLIVDEAFADFEGDGVSDLVGRPGLIVLRSFGKTYGLAGLRLGFGLSVLAPIMREALGAWAVSGPTLAVGTAALRDEAWRRTARARVAAQAARLDAFLAVRGMAPLGGTSLFRYVRHASAQEIWREWCARGVVTRAFPRHPDALRVGLPEDGAWNVLARRLEGWSAP